MARKNTNPALATRGSADVFVDGLQQNTTNLIARGSQRNPLRAGRQQPEVLIQRAIVEHYRLRAAPGVFMFAVPNGGFRRKVEAAIMRATGTVAGVPDTVWIKDGRAYFLELKAEGGRLSEAQERVLIALREAGAMATHAHGLDQALRVLEAWGILRGAVS